MRVAVYHGSGAPITIERVADPQVAGDEVLVKVAFCGICGSDISMTSGTGFEYPAGCHMGHEYSGEVVERGSSVTRLQIGDRVSCVPIGFCGNCRACRDGRLLSCRNGKSQSGGMGEYVAVTETSAVPLIGQLGLVEGALVEPIACARRALRVASFQKGDHVLVVGAGAIALGMIHWCRMLGAGRIGVLSRSERGRENAMHFGADYFVSDEIDGDEIARLLARQDGELPDIVVECVGKTGMIAKAVDHVRPAGKIVSMGMCSQPELLVPVGCTFKEVQLFFPLGYAVEDFEQTMHSFARGDFDATTMVSHVIGLDALPQTMTNLRTVGSPGKILVNPFT